VFNPDDGGSKYLKIFTKFYQTTRCSNPEERHLLKQINLRKYFLPASSETLLLASYIKNCDDQNVQSYNAASFFRRKASSLTF
jgi:hypothetical protein